MAKEKPKINQKVQVNIKNYPYEGCYSSRVEEISSERIVLAAPFKGSNVIPLHIGDVITVTYWTETAGYSFTTEIVDTNYGNLPTITIKHPRQIERIQRRKYLRLPATIPVTYRVLNNPEKSDVYHSFTLDISGGGVLICSPVCLSYNDKLDITLALPQKGEINVVGRVLRIEERIDKKSRIRSYLLGIEFLEINEPDRDKIIAFIFDMQRRMRRKGLI